MTLQPSYEPSLDVFVALLNTYIGEVKTIVELGARDGSETIAFADHYPGAHVYAFECNPETVAACELAVAGRANVTLVPKAVLDSERSVSFFQYVKPGDENPGASSIFPFSDTYPNEQRSSQREIEVEGTTLYRFMGERELSSIDALWMDIQGAELAALRGLASRLTDVRAIFAEVHFGEVYAGQPLFWQTWWFLRRRGFLLYGFPMRRGLFARGYFDDAVFINRHALRGSRLRMQMREIRALLQTALPLYLLVRGKRP